METMNNQIRKRAEVFRKIISTTVAVTFIVSSVYTPGVALAKVTYSPIVNMPQIAASHQYVDSFIAAPMVSKSGTILNLFCAMLLNPLFLKRSLNSLPRR